MAKINVYNLEGKVIEEMEVSDAVFGNRRNDTLVHQVLTAITANQRQVIADTKTRGERAGSGIKPWKQKGTGRARVGSVRNPAWRKGGVAFGPTNDRNFKKKINKKMNQKAIAIVLSSKLKDQELYVIDKIEFAEKKTKKAAEILNKFKLKGKVLMAFSESEKDYRIASRNIKNSENVLTSQMNVYDMLKNKNLFLSKESIEYLDKKYQ